MPKQYYIAVAAGPDAADEERVVTALQAAGVAVEVIEETAREYSGVVYTEDALAEIWRLSSGAEYCRSPAVEGKPPHKEWVELADEQREQFVVKMCEWIGDQRYDQFVLSEHDREGIFDGVAVECHQHEHPYPWERERQVAKAK